MPELQHTGMAAHDGYAEHSHEVRADHGGVMREHTPALPVVRLVVPGLPEQCPHCHMPIAFALRVFGNEVQATCPSCHIAVAKLAVQSK